MTEHHKMRASEVPPYAQAMVLAGLLEQYDNMVRFCYRLVLERCETFAVYPTEIFRSKNHFAC